MAHHPPGSGGPAVQVFIEQGHFRADSKLSVYGTIGLLLDVIHAYQHQGNQGAKRVPVVTGRTGIAPPLEVTKVP